ncbi:extracellular solute-binding protein [Naasia sp. SYSU D00057]|uniref:extracellular solute-binding protein n=1 Tax=Naasia sp. SYSU D00057 TaxID=2817380 RepID=UPI001B3122A8|nr:extracellular solute-binding protein [Naasia sp. SYSU D00057]
MVLSRKRAIAGVALAAISAIALSACGSSGPGQSAGGGASGDGASAWALTGGVHEVMWKESFENWNKDNPDQEIAVEWFANDPYKEKIRTAMGAGTGPSLVFGWGGGTLKEYVDTGKVVSLEGEVDELLDRLIPSIVDGGRVDGELYAVPQSQTQPELIYYNKDLFDQIGAEPPTTWEETMALVPQFKEAGIAPFSLAGASKWPELLWLQYLTDRIGGAEPFAKVAAGEADAWSDPAFAEALTKIQDLVKAGGFAEGFGTVVADANADAALVHTGQAAMLLQGSWVFSSFAQDAPEFVEGGKLGFIPFPTVEGGTGDPANVVGNPSNYWYLNASASDEAKEAAITYLNERVFNDEYTKTLIDGGGVPPVKGIESQLDDAPNGDFLRFAYDLVNNAPNFTLSWDQALPSAAAQELLTNMDQIFLLQITPEEFVANMNATL